MKYASVAVAIGLLVGAAPADSLNVRFVGSCSLPGEVNEVAVTGDYAYVADDDSGLYAISLADLTRPTPVGRLGGGVICVKVRGEYAYVGDGRTLRVLSVSNPTQLTEVGRCEDVCSGAIDLVGDYVYGTVGVHCLSTIAVADPADPVEVCFGDIGGECVDVTASGGCLYVADQLCGLLVLSVADPDNPVEVGALPGHYNSVAASGDYVYVTEFDSGLRVVSIQDPEHPVRMGLCPLPSGLGSVTVYGDYVYVADDVYGLRVVSVADPGHPREVGYYDTPGAALAAAVYGSYVLVAGYECGLQVYEFYGGGVEESPRLLAPSRRPEASVVQHLPRGGAAFDAMGRRVVDPMSGVYFVREEPQAASLKPQAVRKVILQR